MKRISHFLVLIAFPLTQKSWGTRAYASPEGHRREAPLFSPVTPCPQIILFLLIVGHTRHVVRRLPIPPQGCQLRIVGGNKIANRDSHRAMAQENRGWLFCCH